MCKAAYRNSRLEVLYEGTSMCVGGRERKTAGSDLNGSASSGPDGHGPAPNAGDANLRHFPRAGSRKPSPYAIRTSEKWSICAMRRRSSFATLFCAKRHE